MRTDNYGQLLLRTTEQSNHAGRSEKCGKNKGDPVNWLIARTSYEWGQERSSCPPGH